MSKTSELFYVVEAGYAYLQRPVFEGTYSECEEYTQTNNTRDGYMIMGIDEYNERFDEDCEHFKKYGL